MAGPYAPIEAREAQPPRTGLIASARVVDDPAEGVSSGVRWAGGMQWQPESYCNSGGGVVDPCDSGTKDASGGAAVLTYDPVLLWVPDECSAFTYRGDLPSGADRAAATHEERVGRARRRLIACQSKMLANEFWTGELAQDAGFPNFFLASPDSNVVSDGALSEINALACMEDALAACSCSGGMIHVTPGLLVRFQSLAVVERMGNIWRTANDSIVVADAGYDGSGPDGQPAETGSVWMYGSSLVDVRLDEIQVFPGSPAEAMGMQPNADNNLTYFAERVAAATTDGCCHIAVEVDADVCADLENS